jgi:hypothetical protein
MSKRRSPAKSFNSINAGDSHHLAALPKIRVSPSRRLPNSNGTTNHSASGIKPADSPDPATTHNGAEEEPEAKAMADTATSEDQDPDKSATRETNNNADTADSKSTKEAPISGSTNPTSDHTPIDAAQKEDDKIEDHVVDGDEDTVIY